MTAHRFADQLRQVQPAVAAGCSFVPCTMFALFSVTQQAQIQEIYRIAAERTREQLKPKRAFAPAFSLN